MHLRLCKPCGLCGSYSALPCSTRAPTDNPHTNEGAGARDTLITKTGGKLDLASEP